MSFPNNEYPQQQPATQAQSYPQAQPYPQTQSYQQSQPYPQAYAQPQPQLPQPATLALARAPMGWYAVPGTSHIRWWNGENWIAYRLRAGEPRVDWFMIEPPMIGFVLGPIFILLALSQLSLGASGVGFSRVPNAVLFILVGCFWLVMAALMAQVRSKPSPMTGQTLTLMIEPLPGRVEGLNAGWVAVSSRVSRWWSGARWGEYIFENQRVRPTYGGRRAYRRAQIVASIFIGIGFISTVAGVFIFAAMAASGAPWIGTSALAVGITLMVVGGIIFPVLYARRHSYLPPEHAPLYPAAPSQY